MTNTEDNNKPGTPGSLIPPSNQIMLSTSGLHEKIFLISPYGIGVFDFTGMLLKVNSAFATMLGYDASELVGMHLQSLASKNEQNLQNSTKSISTLMSNGIVTDWELELIKKDGSHCIVEVHSSVFTDDESKDQRIMALLHDVTADRSSRLALKESEEQFRTLTESTASAIFIVYEEKIIYANPAAEQIGGSPIDRNAPPSFLDFAHPDMKDEIEQRYRAHMTGTGLPARHEVKILNRQGQVLWIDYIVSSIAYRKARALLITATDITARKAYEQQLKEHQAQQDELNKALQIMLSAADRERRALEENVMASLNEHIFPYLEQVMAAPLEAEQAHSMQIVTRNLKNLFSPLTSQLTSRFASFTPTEARIASLIRDGKNTKQIAQMMCLSGKTVDCHRLSIRKKLNMNNKKVNLETYLRSLQ